MGIGKGSGKDRTTNIVAGSCCAICCGVCFFIIGLPMLIGGIVLVQISHGKYEEEFQAAFDEEIENSDDYYNNNVTEEDVKNIYLKVGIFMIVASLLCVIIGIALVICICTGCCKKYMTCCNTQGQVLQPTSQATSVQYTQQNPGQPNTYYPPQAQNIQHSPPPAYNAEKPPIYGEKCV